MGNLKTNKFKINLKFFFITNYRPVFLIKKKSRHYFCKFFFLFLFFLIFFLKNKLKRSKNKITPVFYTPVSDLKFNLNTILCEKINLTQTHNKFFIDNKKNLNYNKAKNYGIAPSYFSERNRSKIDVKINFIIFTKIYSHFIVLRAPFRDKISKNTLQHQRFYVYLNFTFQKKNLIYFANKVFFFWFIKNFQTIIPLYSNVMFMQSQRILFSIKLKNIFKNY